MISKVLFLALFCAAYVQGRPSSPQGNPDRIVNTWNNVGNTDYINENFNPDESRNGNAHVYASREIVIVYGPPWVYETLIMYQTPTNDNAENIPSCSGHENQELRNSRDTFRQAIDDAVKENFHNLARRIRIRICKIRCGCCRDDTRS